MPQQWAARRISAGFLGLWVLVCGLCGGAQAAVEIVRDDTGLPHVYGDSNYDVFYGLGYISAQDRLFQMEIRKRQSVGRVAEVLGAGTDRDPTKYLKSDKQARALLDRTAISRQLAALSDGDREIVQGFTDGINAAIREMMERPEERLSRPFFDHDMRPEPWTVEDSMITAVHIMGAFSAFNTQLDNLKLYQFLRRKFPTQCDDIFDQLLWREDLNAPTTRMDHPRRPIMAGSSPRGCAAEAVNGLDLGDAGVTAAAVQELVPMEQAPLRASMTWAVGSKRAAGYRSIFVAGPQPGWHSASAYYPVGLHGGDFDVVGMVTTGSFVIRLGMNKHISWASTSGLSSQTDYYQEKLSDDGQKYYYKGDWQPLQRRSEIIRVRRGDDVTYDVLSTNNGALMATNAVGGSAYSQKVAWVDGAVSSVMAWVQATRVQSFDSWLRHIRKIDYSYNLLFADKDGYAGFVHAGAYPKRQAGHDLRFPASGDGRFEWRGRLDAKKNPWGRTKDFMVNFNNKPAAGWPNSGLYWEQWAEANQVAVLIQEMEKKDKLTWDDMWAINRVISYHDVSASFFIPLIAAAAKDKGNDQLSTVVALLTDWDRMRTDDNADGLVDHAGQTIYDAWLAAAGEALLGPTLDGYENAAVWQEMTYQSRPVLYPQHTPIGALILHHAIMNKMGRAGVAHHYDFLAGQDVDQFMLQALDKAVDRLRQTHQGEMAEWRDKATPHDFLHTNAGGAPVAGTDQDRVLPAFMNRGAVNLITAYGHDKSGLRAGYVNPPGQVAHTPRQQGAPESPYVNNHLQVYGDFGLFPLYRARSEVMAHRSDEEIIRLTPKR